MVEADTLMNAREQVLARVRRALSDVPADERPGDVPVPRDYAREHAAGSGDIGPVELFAQRLQDYAATVHRVRLAEVPTAVAGALRVRGARRVVVPAGLPPEWLSELGGIEAVADEPPLSLPALDAVDGVITGAAGGVAETGTLVLDTGPGQGRRALTLVPDYHLCVIPAERVRPDLPGALAHLDPARPLTFVAGPSATSDIEMRRIEGVHGPRVLEVLISGEPPGAQPSGGAGRKSSAQRSTS